MISKDNRCPLVVIKMHISKSKICSKRHSANCSDTPPRWPSIWMNCVICHLFLFRRNLGSLVWIYAAVFLLTSIAFPLIDALSRKSSIAQTLNVLEHETFLEVSRGTNNADYMHAHSIAISFDFLQLFQVGVNFVSLLCLLGLLSIIWWEATCHKPRGRVGRKLIRSRKLGVDRVTAISAPIANPDEESVSIETTMTSELRPYFRHYPAEGVNLYLRLGALGKLWT